MKKIALIFLTMCFSCNLQEPKPSQNKTSAKQSKTITDTERHSRIEAVFIEYGYDQLNLTFFEEDNYILINATSRNEGAEKFEYIEELFWWNNDPYFDQFLLNKIRIKLDEIEVQSKNKIRSRTIPITTNVSYNSTKNC
ncbi:MAG: hypothetical protein HON57_00905 [Flavobacteriaceae bacterium]|jgi:hypothetical protein|nr:hypothetical protein [Candidatus Arcticimaribacter sp.]